MPRSKHARIGGYKLPVFEFTPEQLEVVKKGLVFFAASLQRNHEALPHIAFAQKTYRDVSDKVALLLAEGNVVEFDYNELTVLSACLDMVLIDASFMAQPAEFRIAVNLRERIQQSITLAFSR